MFLNKLYFITLIWRDGIVLNVSMPCDHPLAHTFGLHHILYANSGESYSLILYCESDLFIFSHYEIQKMTMHLF